MRLDAWEVDRAAERMYIVMECGTTDLALVLRNKKFAPPFFLDSNEIRFCDGTLTEKELRSMFKQVWYPQCSLIAQFYSFDLSWGG